MSEEQDLQAKSGHPGPDQCGCGPDSERAAKAEIERARHEIEDAETEIKKGVHDLEDAEAHLKKAEEDLEQAHHHKEVHFFVDGEPFETCDPKTTPNNIICEYGNRDPAQNYLVQIKGHGKDISYQGKGNVPIEIHEGERFQTISVGPAPVSDGRPKTGFDAFIEGLREAGYSPEVVPGKEHHLAFPYEVQTGKRAGSKVHIGLVIPPDFPLSAPGGPHVSPPIYPNKSGGTHPTGGIHDSTFSNFRGQQWQYWSRPVKEWGQTKKTVAIYLAHLWKLWETQ